jgi:hypothetical protein
VAAASCAGAVVIAARTPTAAPSSAPPSFVIRIERSPLTRALGALGALEVFGNERGQPSEIRIKVDCTSVASCGEIAGVPCIAPGVAPA